MKKVLCCILSVALTGASIPMNIAFQPIRANAVNSIEKDSETLVWGDVNLDGVTDIADYELLQNFWERTGATFDGEVSGICGDNVSWKLDSLGKLTISGTGAMNGYTNITVVPWYEYNDSIKEIVIEEGITEIGMDDFYNLTNLVSVTFPETLKKIGHSAFTNCIRLQNITIPDSVEAIEDYAFCRCTLLKNFKFPSNLKTIGVNAFQDCHNLVTIQLPEGLETIGWGAFKNCSAMMSAEIPSGSIGEVAFGGCKLLAYVKLGDGVTEIRSRAFEGCNSLVSMNIPASVTWFSGHDAFNECYQMREINVAEDNPEYASSEGILYSKDMTRLISCPKSKDIVYIPNTVTNIGGAAFFQCYNLWSVIFGKNVQDIEACAFSDCTSLAKVELPESVNHIDIQAFFIIDRLMSIRIPNPDCVIEDDEITIGEGAVIYGCKGSTAEAYAQKYGRTFIAIASTPAETTVATTTTTTTTTKATTSTTTTAKATTPTTTTAKATTPTTTTAKATTPTTTTAKATTPTTTTTKATTPSTPVSTETTAKFEWGKDNWNFGNNMPPFYSYDVNDFVKAQVKKDFRLGNKDMEELDRNIAEENKYGWGGSCYGMVVSSILARQGNLDLTRYGGQSVVNQNNSASNMISLINFIQVMQNSGSMNQSIRQNATLQGANLFPQSQFLQTLVSVLENENYLVKLSYAIVQTQRSTNRAVYGGHAVIAYGVEDASYYSSVTKKKYDKRILIADPNYFDANAVTDEACMYYNSSDNSWIVPYWNYETKNIISRCCWNPYDMNLQNGYIRNIMKYVDEKESLDLMTNITPPHYIAGLQVGNISGNETAVNQVVKTGNNNMDNAGGNGTNIASYFLDSVNEVTDTKNEFYALWNPTASYELSYTKLSDFNLKMDYEDTIYFADVTSATYAQFKPHGQLFELKGSGASYDVSIVTNDELNVTDWYSVGVAGKNVDNLTYKIADNGYLLSANSLKNVTVSAHNETAFAKATFSTDYDTVFIYEIDENTLGISVDTDGDGNYETPIETTQALKNGDVNGDNSVSIVDVLVLNQYLLSLAEIPEEYLPLADVNHDNSINDADAITILKSLVGLAKLF